MTHYETGNYLSIDDILATQARVPCVFKVQVMRLGYLDPSSGNEHIAAGTKQELPFWLARGLCSKNRGIVSIDLPNVYKQGYRDILNADAGVVDLHKLGPFFYEFGVHLLEFPHPDVHEVGQVMVETFKCRFRSLMDSSQNVFHENTMHFTTRLDELERRLFHVGQKCLTDFQRWQTCQMGKITTSTMVSNHRKRKRAENDVE